MRARAEAPAVMFRRDRPGPRCACRDAVGTDRRSNDSVASRRQPAAMAMADAWLATTRIAPATTGEPPRRLHRGSLDAR